MSKIHCLHLLAVVAPLSMFLAACSTTDEDGARGPDERVDDLTARGGETAPASPFDLDAPRFCTVTAYRSDAEPTKFAVGDFVVASVSTTTRSAIPLSKIVMRRDGNPSESRFALYLRREGGARSVMLTPYSPLPLASRDATSLTFKTDSPFQEDISTLKLSVADGDARTVTFEFDETVHGRFGRSITMSCTQE